MPDLCDLETSFAPNLNTPNGRPIVRLDFLDQKASGKLERTKSVTSVSSSVRSDRSVQSTTGKPPPPLRWIEVKFADLAARDKFVSLWQG